MLPSLRAKRTPREGAGPLPALLLDRSYAPVVEAERRNAPELATLTTSVPLYLDQGGSCNVRYSATLQLAGRYDVHRAARAHGHVRCSLSRGPRPTRPGPRPTSRWMSCKLRAWARSRRSCARRSRSRGTRPVHGPEWGWIYLPQVSTHGLGHTSHLAR